MTAITRYSELIAWISEDDIIELKKFDNPSCKVQGLAIMIRKGSNIPGTIKYIDKSALQSWVLHKCTEKSGDGLCSYFEKGGYQKCTDSEFETEDVSQQAAAISETLLELDEGKLLLKNMTIDTSRETLNYLRSQFESFDFNEVIEAEKSYIQNGNAAIIWSAETLCKTWVAVLFLLATVAYPINRWIYGKEYDPLAVPIIGFIVANVIPKLLGDQYHALTLLGYRKLYKLSDYARELGTVNGAVAMIIARTKWHYRFRGDYNTAFTINRYLHDDLEIDIPVPVSALLVMGAKIVRTTELEGLTKDVNVAKDQGYFSRFNSDSDLYNIDPNGPRYNPSDEFKFGGWHKAMTHKPVERYGKEYYIESNWPIAGLHTPAGVYLFNKRDNDTWYLSKAGRIAFISTEPSKTFLYHSLK